MADISSSSSQKNQEEEDDDNNKPSPLGLTLRKTPSFMSLLERCLSKKQKEDDSSSSSGSFKASNFPVLFLKIGAWEVVTVHEGDLVAKLYYAKRKLVWELLHGALKSKIEIQWCDIVAIRAFMPDDEPATLEIELSKPPLFYRESNPQPRRHTLWHQTSDFTGGEASVFRRHYARFPPGILLKNYEKLLQCDQRIMELTNKPYPVYDSPYFPRPVFGLYEPYYFQSCSSSSMDLGGKAADFGIFQNLDAIESVEPEFSGLGFEERDPATREDRDEESYAYKQNQGFFHWFNDGGT